MARFLVMALFALLTFVMLVVIVWRVVPSRPKGSKRKRERLTLDRFRGARDYWKSTGHDVSEFRFCADCDTLSTCRSAYDMVQSSEALMSMKAAAEAEKQRKKEAAKKQEEDAKKAMKDLGDLGIVTRFITNMSSDKSNKKSLKKLPKSYRNTLCDIAERMDQITSRSQDDTLMHILATYCESIEKTTASYLEIIDAPVTSDVMEKTVKDIESAVNDVPPTLDAILASTYESESMNAMLEASALKSVLKHSKSAFSGERVFETDDNDVLDLKILLEKAQRANAKMNDPS